MSKGNVIVSCGEAGASDLTTDSASMPWKGLVTFTQLLDLPNRIDSVIGRKVSRPASAGLKMTSH